MQQSYDAIIVGGGLAGLSCARTLAQAGASFLLIAPSVGGDVYQDDAANLGAYLLTPRAQHVVPGAIPCQRIWLGNTVLWEEQGPVRLFRNALSIGVFALYRRLRSFRREYYAFSESAAAVGQMTALRAFPAVERTTRLRMIDMGWSTRERLVLRRAVDPVVRMCALAEPESLSAFEYLHIAMHIDVPVHTFRLDCEEILAPIRGSFLRDFVEAAHRANNAWCVRTARNGVYHASHVVVAAGSHHPVISGTPSYPDTRYAKSTLWHLEGTVRSSYRRKLHVFPVGHSLYFLHEQDDGTIVLASAGTTLDVAQYVDVVRVLRKHVWEKAFPIGVRPWHPQEIGDGMFMIDDYNVVGMEDACRSGMWAASRILS